MRCKACDANLSDLESTRRFAESKQFVDLCNSCIGKFEGTFPETTVRNELLHEEDTNEND